MKYTSHPDIELHIINRQGLDVLTIMDKNFESVATGFVISEEIADDIIEFLEEYKNETSN
jgi:hypothetical protein